VSKRYVVDRETNRRRVARDDEMIADGGRVRVPLMMRDAAPRTRVLRDADGEIEVADWQVDAIRDIKAAHAVGQFDDELAVHKPGQRFVVDQAARERVEQARQAGIKDMCDAWRGSRDDPRTGFGSGSTRGQQPGDQCTINGAPGHLDADLECIADDDTNNADGAVDARDRAWLAMKDELESAWKNAK
jgi:hypothetical protein